MSKKKHNIDSDNDQHKQSGGQFSNQGTGIGSDSDHDKSSGSGEYKS